jgi:hypothetical protein
LNVLFSGIGDEFVNWQKFFDAVTRSETDFAALAEYVEGLDRKVSVYRVTIKALSDGYLANNYWPTRAQRIILKDHARDNHGMWGSDGGLQNA